MIGEREEGKEKEKKDKEIILGTFEECPWVNPYWYFFSPARFCRVSKLIPALKSFCERFIT